MRRGKRVAKKKKKCRKREGKKERDGGHTI